MKREKETRNKILKVCLLIICSIFIVGASQATSVQAASDATMKKAYQKNDNMGYKTAQSCRWFFNVG